MSDNIVHNLAKWGIPMGILKKARHIRNKCFQAPFGVDSADLCWLGKDYWKTYPVQEFDYQFNSWGCRDHDYEQYRKENTDQKVNLCIGDSFTLNVGGPQQHSWPYLLAERTGIPSLNLSSDGLSSYYFQNMVDKNKELLNVENIFVLYNVLSDAETISSGPGFSTDINQTLMFLKKHYWIHDAHWQVIPPWCFLEHELRQLYQQLPTAHDYLKNTSLNLKEVNVDLLLICYPIRQRYNEMAGSSWMSYDDFVKEYLLGTDVLQFFSHPHDKNMIREFVTNCLQKAVRKILFCNRDTLHMNKKLNQQLADYFYQQSCVVKLR